LETSSMPERKEAGKPMGNDWLEREPEFDSPYYPFRLAVAGNTIAGAEQLPYVIGRYLMDPADGNGYIPPSDNRFPRARIKKLVYWDGNLPLNQPLPTDEQVRDLVFNPLLPANPPDKERGYRIFLQEFAQQAQYDAQTRLHIYHGSGTMLESAKGIYIRQQIIIKITCNYALESNTGMTAVSRSYDIAQAVVEAINGVSFGGVGGMRVTNLNKIDDERVNTGFKIYANIDWMADAPNPYFS